VYKASFALSLSLALVLGFGAPAGAAESPFEDGAEKAVKKVAPGLKRVERDTRQSRSVLDADQKIKEDTVTFRGNGRVVAVMRAVGAVAPVNGETVAGRAKQRKTVKAKRARVGTRKVLIYKTGEGGPGLTIAAWTERTGVNYQIVSRASRKAPRAIEKAPPAAPQPEVTQRSTSSLFVDGAGDPKDDFGDEANLCNGCSYSHSNYVWLWQRILMADAYLQGSLDCSFGSLTAAGTKNWQGAHGLTKDGVVGKQTRTVADNFLVDLGGSSVRYLGLAQNILFDRLTSNAYYYGSKRINYTNATLC
jgi:peptidoglycan hydrolase-like protein with peptidoglycan-binding domain